MTIDANIADSASVGLDKSFRLDEHTPRAAAGVIDPATIRGQHLHQHANDTAGRVELATLLALSAGKLGEEILVDPADDILGAVGFIPQADGADQVDQLTKALFIQVWAGVVLGQHTFERGVIALDGEHGVIEDLADGRLLGHGLEIRPARLFGHPEDVGSPVLVRVFGVGPLGTVRFEQGMLLFKGIRDVFKED